MYLTRYLHFIPGNLLTFSLMQKTPHRKVHETQTALNASSQIFTLPPKLRNGILPQTHRLPAPPPSQCDSTVHPAMKPTHPLNLCTRCFYSGIIWFFSKSVTSFFLALSSVLKSTSLHTATTGVSVQGLPFCGSPRRLSSCSLSHVPSWL